MYSFGLYGLSHYGISNVKTQQISISGKIAEARQDSVTLRGTVSEAKTTFVSASARVAQAKAQSIQAYVTISAAKGPHTAQIGGRVSEGKSLSVNAYGYVSGWETLPINIRCLVGQYRVSECYVRGRIVGFVLHSINASAKVAEAKGPLVLDIKGNIAQDRFSYINSRLNIGLARETSLSIRSHVKGYNNLNINLCGRVAQLNTHPLNIKGNVATGVFYSRQIKGRVAQRLTHQANMVCTVAQSRNASLNIKSTIAQRLGPATINSRFNISTERVNSIQAAGRVARLYAEQAQIKGNLSLIKMASVNLKGTVTIAYTTSVPMWGYLMQAPYYYLNGVDITKNMLQGITNKGPAQQVGKRRFPGKENVLLLDEGYDPTEYSFKVFFKNITDAFDYVNKVKNNTEMVFYPGDSLWFHKVKFINIEREKRRAGHYFEVKTTVLLEKPWLYFCVPVERDLGTVPLPRTSEPIRNAGHYNTTLDLLRITARYNNGKHLKEVTYTITDGLNDYHSIMLSDKLLSDEVAELDESGDLTCTYEEPFNSVTRFNQDATASNCEFEINKIVVKNNGYFIYNFPGPWPMNQNLAIDAKLNIVSGNPVVEVSNDGGATWSAAIPTEAIVNGVVERYYIDNTDKYANISIRFRCDASSKMEVHYLKFTSRRRTKAVETPYLPAGTTRRIKISDSFDSSNRATIFARFREKRRGI